MTLQPLADRLVVKSLEAETKSPGGIILPETAKEKPQMGKVVAVGPGRYKHGERVPMDVKVGDTILYTKYGPTEVKINGEELLLLKEEDVLAVVKK